MTPALAAAVAMAAGALLGGVAAWALMARRLVEVEARIRYLTHLRAVGDRDRAARMIERGLMRGPS